MRIPYISLLAAGALSLGGCADYYGYGGDYYGGYGSPYYGWYDNYYYPGSGLYVYDTYRRPHVMTTTQRTYWSQRSPSLRAGSTTRARENWSGFKRRERTHNRG